MRQAKAVKVAAKAALKARGGVSDDDDEEKNKYASRKKKSQGKALATGRSGKMGNQNENPSDDEDDDDEVTFRMASVSGFRAAAGIDVTPFSASKGRAGRALSSTGAMSDAQRLKRMYGVTCGNDADGDGLADDDEVNEEPPTSDAPPAAAPVSSTTRGDKGARDSLAVPMADRGLAKPVEMVAKKGSTELEQKRLEMDALRNLVLERLYAIDVAPLHKDDDDGPDAEATAGGGESSSKENEAPESLFSSELPGGASNVDDNENEGSTAAAEVEETLIVTRLALPSNGLRKRLPDCFHGLRSLVSACVTFVKHAF
jgi:hypothetical protein